MPERKVILTEAAPQPRGPYSQAVVHKGMMYISAQGPIDPVTNKLINGTIEQETKRILENIKVLVAKGGGSLEKILKINCYLSDIGSYSEFNDAYKDYFIKEPPARTVTEAGLPLGMKVMMDAVAALE